MKFEKWMNQLNKLCLAKFGLNIEDLPDQEFDIWFHLGMTPAEALQEIAKNEELYDTEEAESELEPNWEFNEDVIEMSFSW